jgi:creatinine amidohydrolase
VLWADLTSAAHAAIDRDTPAVVPIGSIEQHGAYLPVSTDAFLATRFATLVERAIPGRVLVLPTVTIGMSEHHMDFPGTLTVEHRVLFDYLTSVLESVAKHGYRRILVLNAHGGNQATATAVVERFGRRNPDSRVVLTSWWAVAGPELLALSEASPGGVGHADELETSLMLHAAPDLVDASAIRDPDPNAVPDWASGDMQGSARAFLYRTARDWSKTGVLGRPSAASAGKGAAAEAAIVERLVEIVETLPDRAERP